MEPEEHITEMSERLGNLHAADREARLRDVLLRWIEDPLKPRTDSGNLRPNRMLLLLAALALAAAGTFLIFGMVRL